MVERGGDEEVVVVGEGEFARLYAVFKEGEQRRTIVRGASGPMGVGRLGVRVRDVSWSKRDFQTIMMC